MSGAGRPGAAADPLSAILLSGLQQLAACGHADEACRLAGRACAALRQTDPLEWKKFNAFLHRVARVASEVGGATSERAMPYGSSSLSQ